MFNRKENSRPLVCLLSLVFGISIFLLTISLAYSENNPSKLCLNCKKKKWTEGDSKAHATKQIHDLVDGCLGRLQPNEPRKSKMDAYKLPPEMLKIVQPTTTHSTVNADPNEPSYPISRYVPGYDLETRCIPSEYVTGCYFFDHRGTLEREVASVRLMFYKTQDDSDQRGQIIQVVELGKNNTRRSDWGHKPTGRAVKIPRENSECLAATRVLHAQVTYKRQGWIGVDIDISVVSMSSKKTTILAIQCKTCYNRNPKSLFGYKDGYIPQLKIVYKLPRRYSQRTKRSVDDVCNPETDCCLRDMEVDLTNPERQVNPKVLSTGYCHGVCPSTSYFSNYSSSELEPCCVPVSWRSTTMGVARGSSSYEQIDVHNAVVTECGCK